MGDIFPAPQYILKNLVLELCLLLKNAHFTKGFYFCFGESIAYRVSLYPYFHVLIFIACLFGRQVFQWSHQPDKVIPVRTGTGGLAGVTSARYGRV